MIFGQLTAVGLYISFRSNGFWPSYGPWTWKFGHTFSFSNISAISWRPVLVVEEAGVPTENHRPWTSNMINYHLRLQVECILFCNLQSRAGTYAILVIGLYELLGNPTT
jgi:hypothetical protein